MMKMSLVALFATSALAISAAPKAVRYAVARDGNEARYRVREQLMHHDLPNDAVGKTTAITGDISLTQAGAVDTAASKITIDVTSLKSDQERRDGYVQHRTLETDKYPTVSFVPVSKSGAMLPLTAAAQTFEVQGMLTVHGVTKPTVWHVTAKSGGNDVTGSGWTQFTFTDVQLAQPRVPVLLSVADTIKLEYDFHLVRQP
ncbi:MAG: YceI family protein [Gemmatimonadaceae bacterium]|nr:YceI family protein [Gemmatimonadaceae bacterium]